MKTYLAKFENALDGMTTVLYVGDNKADALTKIQACLTYDFSIDVWECGMLIGSYVCDGNEESVNYVDYRLLSC